jgi:ubiquinone/menaquinone biosynthesis C-methylase UbiE
MLELAGLQPGMRVLDLATGRGEPAIRAAHRVGSAGRVVGVDPSAAMLAMAEARARREGLGNLELRAGDAADADVFGPGPYDAVLCRWGLMYMAQPDQALAAIRKVVSRDARIVVAVFVEPARVSWFTEPRRFLPPERAAPAPDFEVPGPFRFAPPGKLAHALEQAGFRVTHVEEQDVPVTESRDASDVVAWCRDFGLAKLLEGLPPAADATWTSAFRQALEAQRAADGLVRLGGVTRVVVAAPV